MSDKENSETASGLCAGCGRKYDVLYRKGRLYYCEECLKSVKPSLASARARTHTRLQSQPARKPSIKTSRKNSKKGIIIIIIVIIIGFVVFYGPNFNIVFNDFGESIKNATGQIKGSIESLTPKPPTLEELQNYALNEINKERNKHGLQNVTLSNITSAQLHANDMLANQYFSHWNLQGLKPHMRYTLAGGKGDVSENIGYKYTSGIINPYEAIKDSIYNMMYDDAESDWGHRDNILDAIHNKVSIGIAYNSNYFYFVQDFENDYFENAIIEYKKDKNIVLIKLEVTKKIWNPNLIAIFYEPLPTNLTVFEISETPYDGSYDLGTLIGGVVTSKYYIPDKITITASNWINREYYFEAEFDMFKVLDVYGEGVYTICIYAYDEYWTSYSIWITD